MNAGIEIISPVIPKETMKGFVRRQADQPDKIDLDRDVLKKNVRVMLSHAILLNISRIWELLTGFMLWRKMFELVV